MGMERSKICVVREPVLGRLPAKCARCGYNRHADRNPATYWACMTPAEKSSASFDDIARWKRLGGRVAEVR